MRGILGAVNPKDRSSFVIVSFKILPCWLIYTCSCLDSFLFVSIFSLETEEGKGRARRTGICDGCSHQFHSIFETVTTTTAAFCIPHSRVERLINI